MKFKYVLCLGLFLSQVTMSAGMTEYQYEVKARQVYDLLNRTQKDLSDALDQRAPNAVILTKTCTYASNLRYLEKVSLENLRLKKAQEDADFMRQLIVMFDQSFADLSTTYERACKR